MGFKKAILAILLLIILTMGAASAADTNTTSNNLAATEDTNLELNENDKTLSIDSTDVISGPGNGSYTPGNGTVVIGGTFSDLDTLIQNAGSELNLSENYTYINGDPTSITIDKQITINGNGITIDANNNASVFKIVSDYVKINNITFINCRNETGCGGAIYCTGINFDIYNCSFINCYANDGGSIYCNSHGVSISSCDFINSSASNNGGAINIMCQGDIITNCIFTNCHATRGGAIYSSPYFERITNCIFVNCSANYGGAYLYSGNEVEISNCLFVKCSANYGGAIFSDTYSDGEIRNSEFINLTGSNGPAIYDLSNLLEIINSTFEDKTAQSLNDLIYGGIITNCTLNENLPKNVDLDISIVSNITGSCQIGDSIEFTVTVTNAGPSDATGTYVSITYSELQIMNSYDTLNGSVGAGNSSEEMFWTIGNLGAGETATLTITSKTLQTGNSSLSVTVVSSLNDVNTSNNAASSIISILAKASTLTIDTNINGSSVTLMFTIPEDAMGTISITVDGTNYNKTPVGGKSSLNLNLAAGTYPVSATYSGDVKYMPTTNNTLFIVNTIAGNTFTDLKSIIDAASPGDTIKLEDDYTNDGSITADGIAISKAITIDGKGHTLDAKGSSRIFKINAENVTLKNIIFKNGHGNNGGAIQWMNTKGVAANCTFINCSAENGGSVYWNGENGMINTSTFDHSTATSNGGAIYWNANNGEIANSIFTNSYAQNGGAVYVPENRNVEIKSSIFDSNIAEEESGAVYGGTVDDDCTFKNNTYTPLNTTTIVSINETAVYTGNDISITTIVLSQKGGFANTGTVEIYINSKLMATIPANTQYIHTTGEIGTYQVLAKFIDDSSYKGSSSTAEFTVIPVDIPEEIETNNEGIFTLEFPDDAEGTLTVFIDGVKYKVYDIIGGILKIDLSDKKGKYNITFEYSGDDNYPAFKKDTNATIQTNPSITASNAKVLYSAGTTYKITVYKNKGILAKSVSVTIKLNNKKLKPIKTNSKGVASFKVTQTPGTYKLKITTLGTTVTKTLTVKHIVTLKAVKVKKSTKKLILQANLAKVNKKYLKKKTVTFKFNGKTYKAKTNAKGVAKVTIKKSVLKKLKIGKKITYQATYLKDTVKKTVKVKK